MTTFASLNHHQHASPQHMYQQAINTSMTNALTGDTLLLIQIMCMTPAAIFFAVCFVIHLYQKARCFRARSIGLISCTDEFLKNLV
ncbi:MAG: hypothetical protein ACFE0I_21775 [Elainellaceae cyanobacterium]